MLAAGLAVFGAAFLLLWGEATSPDAPSAASSGPAPGGAATSAAADADTVSTGPDPVPRPVGTRPVRLRIPGIGVVTDLVGLGLQGDGTVEVPVRAEQAGWYRLGPRPGDSGSAVVLGHVDSAEGPAVFARLATLEPGDRVHVDRADGTVATFRVRTVTTTPTRSSRPSRSTDPTAGGSSTWSPAAAPTSRRPVATRPTWW